MLAFSTFGQSASSAVVNGPAFLIPTWHAEGMSLAHAGLLGAAAWAGSACSLIVWGLVVDATRERFAMVLSLIGSGLALVVAVLLADNTTALGLALFVAGIFAAGTSSASGRLIVGWFPRRRRGTAMGIRQMSQPVGVATAAMLVPVLASRYGAHWAIGSLGAMSLVAAVTCLVGIIDPPRPARSIDPRAANPYRGSIHLARVHAASVLLVIPQVTLWSFMLVWLQVGRDWTPEAAGSLVAVAQLLGAVGRIGAGTLSDVVGSRLRPMRWVAIAAGASMLLLGIAIAADSVLALGLILFASVVTVADNGLAFTEVAERAGPWWSGRALGIQNTGQYLAATGVPPAVGAGIAAWGYAAAFGVTGLFPLLALLLIPRDDSTYTIPLSESDRRDYGEPVAP